MVIVRGRVVEREMRKGGGGQGVFWIEGAVRGGGWFGGMRRVVDRAMKRGGRRWSGCMVGMGGDEVLCVYGGGEKRVFRCGSELLCGFRVSDKLSDRCWRLRCAYSVVLTWFA